MIVAPTYTRRVPILVSGKIVGPQPFECEKALEDALASHPQLLCDDGEGSDTGPSGIAVVCCQLKLPEDAGTLDLLLVNDEGLPIAVEVKLERNGESRRQVIAQGLDYLSALTSMTVDELDECVSGNLRICLRKFAHDEEAEFERLWRSVGANLRAGRARLIVALDDIPVPLERIFRFLARVPQLDLQLVALQQYETPVGQVIVSRARVTSLSGPERNQSDTVATPEFMAVVRAYDELDDGLHTSGSAATYRHIFIPGWPTMVKYQLEQSGRNQIKAALFLDLNKFPAMSSLLSGFQGTAISGSANGLEWEPEWNWKYGKGRLFARFPITAQPTLVAQGMAKLISSTRSSIDAFFHSQVPQQGAN